MDTREKLLERMRRSKSGWGESDLESLYAAFGFEFRDRGGHRFYKHPRYPQLYATVARHRRLPVGYVQTAVKLIQRLKALEGEIESE